MDVNKLQGVHADGDQPHRQQYDRHHDTPDDTADGEVRQEAYRLRSSDVVVDLSGMLSGPLSVESEKIVNAFVAQIEPLRAELEILRKREEHFRDQAAQHAFLPLPNRREFRRELNYVIDHMHNLQPSPAVLMLHVVTAAPFRREYGRRAADALLIHVAKIDENYTEKEKKIIVQALIEMGADKSELNEIIIEAEKKEKDSNQILDFTREVKNLTDQDKIKIIEALWSIIYSNKEADVYETNLMRRLAGLLYIDTKTMGDIKERIKNQNSK